MRSLVQMRVPAVYN